MSCCGDKGAGRGIIWDLDGTLYRYSAGADDHFSRAVAQGAVDGGVPGTVEEIAAEWLAIRSEYTLVEKWQAEFSFDFPAFHAHFHELCDERIVVGESEGVAEAMRGMPLPQVILTHGCLPWARRVLDFIGVGALFPDERVIDLEAAGYVFKHAGVDPFLLAAQRLGIDPEAAMMVEDSARNLKHAHALGMHTALVHHGRVADPLPDFVDFQCENPLGVLERVYTLCGQERAAS